MVGTGLCLSKRKNTHFVCQSIKPEINAKYVKSIYLTFTTQYLILKFKGVIIFLLKILLNFNSAFFI